MKLTITLCLLLCSLISSAQIVTPGFVRFNTCPTSYSQVDYCTGWRQPTGGTSDYFNACATGTDVDVPKNMVGYQNSIDNAYVGLGTYAPASTYDYKEYIGTTISPLVIGNTYTMSITVSLSDSSSYATDGLGVFFSTYQLDSPGLLSTLHVTPQVDYSGYGTIKEKNNWVTLNKTFVADSAYTNLIVGCFKPLGILHIDSVANGGNDTIVGRYSYYYIGRIGIPDSSNGSLDTVAITYPDTVKHVFPNAFTPNGDGWNDVFRIITSQGYLFYGYTLSIYNRYGQRVFFSENPSEGWNGIFNGVPQEIGAYYYMATYNSNGETKLLKGDLTLIR